MSTGDVPMSGEHGRKGEAAGLGAPEPKRSKTEEEKQAGGVKGEGAMEEVKKEEPSYTGEVAGGPSISPTGGGAAPGEAAAGGAGVAQTIASPAARADTKRMMERHMEYVQSQRILAKLPDLFPDWDQSESNGFLIWLAQLPVAMHRPRPLTSEHGWKAAGEIMTCQWDEKVPTMFKKLIENNISCVPVLDVRRRYVGICDYLTLVAHALKSFGVMEESESAKDPARIAAESVQTSAAQGAEAMMEDVPQQVEQQMQKASEVSGRTDAEAKLEQVAATGGPSATVQTAAGTTVEVRPTGPVHVRGDREVFANRPLWRADYKAGEKQAWGQRTESDALAQMLEVQLQVSARASQLQDWRAGSCHSLLFHSLPAALPDVSWWDRQDFKEMSAGELLMDSSEVTLAADTPGAMLGRSGVPRANPDILAPPLVQGSSTLFAVELMARMGLHRAPILNSERFVTGLISESMLISLISQYRALIPSFLTMPVERMESFLLPHRLIVIPETAVTAEAYLTFVRERVNGGAIVNSDGVLVDVLSTRDLRGIGRSGADFERLWMIVREFKETVRSAFPDKTPHHVRWVGRNERMDDVLTKMSDGNLHRIFLCDKGSDGLPRPIAVITQRDVLRLLLVYCGLTLQGEVRVATA